MVNVVAYTPPMADLWNRAVDSCRNATFLHQRGYMDYHAERFTDISAVAAIRGRIAALFPAAVSGDTAISHPGLTYGGVLTSIDASFFDVNGIIGKLTGFYSSRGLRRLEMTPAPYIYNRVPSDDISFILATRFNASVKRRFTSVVDMSCAHLSQLRRRCVKKAEKLHLYVTASDQIDTFYAMLLENLATRHNGAVPVHSLPELRLLMSRFPRNIVLYATFEGSSMLSAALLYITPMAVRTQYIASTPSGRSKGAVDLLLSTIINRFSSTVRYLDLGTSASDSGDSLNPGLIFQKEGFGARSVSLDTYSITLN